MSVSCYDMDTTIKPFLRIAFIFLTTVSVLVQAGEYPRTIEGMWFDEQTKRTITISRQHEEWTVHGLSACKILITRVNEQYIFFHCQSSPTRREEFMLELSTDAQGLSGHYIVIVNIDGTEAQGSTPIAWRRVLPDKRK